MNLQIFPIHHIPEIRPSADLARAIREGIRASDLDIEPKDVVAVTQKVVSKAENRVVRLSDVRPSSLARSIARQARKDPRVVEVILSQTRRIVRMSKNVLICETHQGFICANAGVDRSNVDGGKSVTLLPEDPDHSAAELAGSLGCGILITDTFGRPWREGLVDVTIGLAAVPPFLDIRGTRDSRGYLLQATLIAAADALAGVAGLVMGKTDNIPAALIRGFRWEESRETARALLRSAEKDLFR